MRFMALIDCPECGREISNRAPACIHCGFPLTSTNTQSELIVVEQVSPVQTWIIGRDWTLPKDGKEQRVHCLDCDRDVYFPAGQEKHATHRVEPLVWSPKGWYPMAAPESPATRAGRSSSPNVESAAPSMRWEWGRIANFRSRTLRIEFWTALLILTIVVAGSRVWVAGDYPDQLPLVVVLSIPLILWLLWGATANRLHDMGQSGWLVLLYLIPLVNLGLFVWVGVGEGEPGPNKWGPPVA